MKSVVVAYKYGITKYDVTTNNYTLYSDGSKELLDSWSYMVYDSTNYSAMGIGDYGHYWCQLFSN